MGTAPGRTPCSDLFFFRSRDDDALSPDSREVWQTYYAPVHAELIKTIHPKVLVCFGGKAWNWVIGRDPGHWNFHPSIKLNVSGFDYTCGVLLLPHPSGRWSSWRKYEATFNKAITGAHALAEATN